MKKLIIVLCSLSIILYSCDTIKLTKTVNANSINIDDSSFDESILETEEINNDEDNTDTLNLTKDELFYLYFSDFYDYIVDYKNGMEDLNNHNINSKDDFYIFLKIFEGGAKGFNTAGNLLGKYYLKKDIGGSIKNQKANDGFVGYCIENNMYMRVHEFFVDFFANYRKDEGYTGEKEGQYKYGSDFLAIPNDSIVDIIKYFYYNSITLPNYFKNDCRTRTLIDYVPNYKSLINNATSSDILHYQINNKRIYDYFGVDKDQFPIYCVSVNKKDKQRFHHVALTFDSGVNVDQTINILNVLDEYKVKATFFLTYDAMLKSPKMVQEIVYRGHEVANHSQTHPNFKEITKEQIIEEIVVPHNYIKELCGVEMNLFRFPYGSYNEEVVKTVKELGYYPIQWSHDSKDWLNDSLENIILRTCVDDKIYSGCIMLFHNGPIYTPLALPTIINYIKEKGYKFSKVSDLIYQEDFYLKSGKQYKKQ